MMFIYSWKEAELRLKPVPGFTCRALCRAPAGFPAVLEMGLRPHGRKSSALVVGGSEGEMPSVLPCLVMLSVQCKGAMRQTQRFWVRWGVEDVVGTGHSGSHL
jgi:hypothetical protein